MTFGLHFFWPLRLRKLTPPPPTIPDLPTCKRLPPSDGMSSRLLRLSSLVSISIPRPISLIFFPLFIHHRIVSDVVEG